MNRYIEGAFFPLIKPRNIRVVPISSYLKDNSNYNKKLLACILYSMLVPGPNRYYYSFVKAIKPKVNIEQMALINSSLLVDYSTIYDSNLPTLIKVKSEILSLLDVYR